MNNNIEELIENLPKECCSFCTHLSLDGPTDDFEYNIKCVMLDALPTTNQRCSFFEPEYCDLTDDDLNRLYLEFLEACVRVKFDTYLKSTHWKIFKEQALKNNNYTCSICGSKENLDVIHGNKNLGRENLDDVIVACEKCISK